MSDDSFTMIVVHPTSDDSVLYPFLPKGVDPVKLKISYTQPYEDFKAIKQIQYAVRQHDIFERASTVIAIDITDYLGYENEEYFTILTKYLYDMSMQWRYIFVIKHVMNNEVNKMFIKLRFFLAGSLVINNHWDNKTELVHYICSRRYIKKAAELLADILLTEKFSNYRSDIIIDNIASEILNKSNRNNVTLTNLAEYIKNQNSIINLVLGSESIKYSSPIIGLEG